LEPQNCPKCKSLLNQSEITEGRKRFHCWGCGLTGTYAEMVKSAIDIARRKYQNASRMTCRFCGKKKAIWYDLFPTLIVDGGPTSVPACKDCRPEVAKYLLKVPAVLLADDVPFTPRRTAVTAPA
jgi:DNA-directed RNA polymerase subunit M/transcription elongation factor TFIIS